jgi:hypothetical protein
MAYGLDFWLDSLMKKDCNIIYWKSNVVYMDMYVKWIQSMKIFGLSFNTHQKSMHTKREEQSNRKCDVVSWY